MNILLLRRWIIEDLCIEPANAYLFGMQWFKCQKKYFYFFLFAPTTNITSLTTEIRRCYLYARDSRQINQQCSVYNFIYSVGLYIHITNDSNCCQKCQKWYGKVRKRQRKMNRFAKATSFENVLIAIHMFSEVFSAVPKNDTQHKRQVQCSSDVSSLKWEVETLSQRLKWCTDCHSF